MVGIWSEAGYEAQLHWSLVGLDVKAKAKLLGANIGGNLGSDLINFTVNGSSKEDAESQNAATVDFRIFVQAKDEEDLSVATFIEPDLNVIMCTYQSATPQPATTAGLPRPYHEYWVSLFPQSSIQQRVHFTGRAPIDIPIPTVTRVYPTQQASYDTESPKELSTFSPAKRRPLRWIIHARSGDKGFNANVRFRVCTKEDYERLRSLLTANMVKRLPRQEYKLNNGIDRFKVPGILGVHFLLPEHLDRGINSSCTYDILGKNVGEILRARHVDILISLLSRPEISVSKF